MRQATWVIIIGLVIGFSLMPVASYAKNSYFGVSNKALAYPQEFDETEAVIVKAEQSPGAKNCPDKLAKAKELPKRGSRPTGHASLRKLWNCLLRLGSWLRKQNSVRVPPPKDCYSYQWFSLRS